MIKNLICSYDYFPYGKLLRKYVQGSGHERYLTTQHERDAETISENSDGTGFTNAGARLLDHDKSSFTTIDPLADQFPSWSPYSYAFGNPVRFIDPDGRSPDDITVNDAGTVTDIVRNDEPNRFFDKEGNQLHFNDPKNADNGQSEAKYYEGDRLFFPVSNKQLSNGINSAGHKSLSLTANMFGRFGFINTAIQSHGKADFTMSFLSKNFDINKSGSNGGSAFRSGFTEQAGYFKFQNSNTIFNLYDAGNFMWGNWMKSNGYSQDFSTRGAKLNSLMFEGESDTGSDQNAIIEGFNYKID